MEKNRSPIEEICASPIGLGCMRLTTLPDEEAVRRLVDTALENGIRLFDHADIYNAGASEALFGRAIPPSYRDRILLQSKCSIRPGVCYDLSREHILESVEGSLRRLGTDHLDLLLLHRPDALAEPEEVAEAFAQLRQSGKVLAFGVSNHSPMQIELLNRACGGQIRVNQIQMSLAHCPGIDAGFHVNMEDSFACSRGGDILSYSRLQGIKLQAWSPFQYGTFRGSFIGNAQFPALNKALSAMAEKYGITENAVAIAWLLRHPARITPIVGTMNPERLKGIAAAAGVRLSREDWYALYLAAGKDLP